MNKIFFLLIAFFSISCFAQDEITVIDKKSDSDILELPFAVIEQIPVFSGCENVERKESSNCFNDKMNKHIAKHFTYPSEAVENNIQGRVNVEFIIDINGNVTKIKTSNADPILQKEVKRIFSLMPKLKPGKQNGIPVNVIYTMPIIFKIQ